MNQNFGTFPTVFLSSFSLVQCCLALIWGSNRQITHSYCLQFAGFSQSGANSKSISLLGKSKCKSYLASQYWASLNTNLTSLASLNQDLDFTWKLIPKSKVTFQQISSEDFEFKKISQRATIFVFIIVHFLGAH